MTIPRRYFLRLLGGTCAAATAGAPLSSSEEFEVVQDGVSTRCTETQIGDIVNKTQVGLGNVTNDAQLKINSNLADLQSAATARTNLDVYSTGQVALTTSSVNEAESLTLTAAPGFIKTSGFAEAGDKGGALYKMVAAEPTHAGKFSISIGGAPVWYEIAEPIPNPRMFGAKDDGVTDTTTELQSFFDYVTELDVGTASLDGAYRVNGGLTLGPATGTIATRNFVGDFRLQAAAANPVVLTIQNFSNLVWEGRIEVIGTGSADYASQTCEVGVKLTGQGSRSRFGGFVINNFKFAGIHTVTAGGNTNMTQLGQCRINNIGSGNWDFAETANWSNQVNAGGANSTSQTSTIDVDDNLPLFVEDHATVDDAPLMVRINAENYYITAVDRVGGTITVHPWIDADLLGSGTLEYVFGAAVFMSGANTNVYGVDLLDAFRCSIGLAAGALFAPTVGRLVTQRNGVAWAIGRNRSSSALGGSIQSGYFEDNRIDVAYIAPPSSSNHSVLISDYALDFGECFTITNPRDSSNVRQPSSTNFNNMVVIEDGEIYQREKVGSNDTGSSLSLEISAAASQRRFVYKRDSWTINLTAADNATDINRLFGYDTLELTLFGTGANKQPTGTITFNPPVGFTVNGTTSAFFTGLTTPAHFIIYWDIANSDFIVFNKNQMSQGDRIARVHTAIAALNFPSIPAQDSEQLAITVTGAAINDNVILGPPAGIEADLTWCGFVSAADTVTVRLINPTGAAIDPASATWRATVIGF